MTIVERQACRVKLAHLVIHCLNIRTYPTLISKTPKDDAWMIEVTFHQRFCAIHMCLLPSLIMPHLFVGIATAMTLLISLVHHIEPPSIAEFIKIFAIRIVRRTQKINIGLLHQSNVRLIGSIIYIATCDRMMVMTIHATQLYILAVDFENLSNGFYPFHSQMIIKMLNHVTLLIYEFNAKRIEMRLLSRPQTGIIYQVRKLNMHGIASPQRFQSPIDGMSIQLQHSLHIFSH